MGAKDAAVRGDVPARGGRRAGVPLLRGQGAAATRCGPRLEVDDLTAAVDPRVTGALLELRLPHDAGSGWARCAGGWRRRSCSRRCSRPASPRRTTGTRRWSRTSRRWSWRRWPVGRRPPGARRGVLRPSPALPEEARLRRLAYLAESATHLEQLVAAAGRHGAGLAVRPGVPRVPRARDALAAGAQRRGDARRRCRRWRRRSWACRRARSPRTARTTSSSTCAARCAARRSCWSSRRRSQAASNGDRS